MKYLNQTQREQLTEHFSALNSRSMEAEWMCMGHETTLEPLKFKYDECARLMETIRVMLSAVENNNESL